MMVAAAAVATASLPMPTHAAGGWGADVGVLDYSGKATAPLPDNGNAHSSPLFPSSPSLDRNRRSRWNKDSSSWVGPSFNYADEGGVYAWGDAAAGGSTSSPVNIKESLAYGVAVERVFVNKVAFAALVEGGGVVTWGDAGGGGDSSAVAAELEKDVHTIYATDRAFAARKRDGTVVVWGDADYGGTINPAPAFVVDSVASQVKEITCTSRAFAALTRNGTVHVWGDAAYGGTYDGSEPLHGIDSVHANDYAFVAITAGNGAIAWGDAAKGGSFPETVSGKMTDRVARVWSTEQAFVALRYGTTTTTTTTATTTTMTTTTTTTTATDTTTTTTTASTTTTTATDTTTTTASTTTVTTTTGTTTTSTTGTTTTTVTTTTTTTTTTATTTTYTSTTTATTVTLTTTVTTVTATTTTATSTTTTHICSAVFGSIAEIAHCCADDTSVAQKGAQCTSLEPDNACSLAVLPDNALSGAAIASCDGTRPYCYAPEGSPCNDTNTGIVGQCNYDGQCGVAVEAASNIEVWKVAGPIIGVIGFVGLIFVAIVIHRKCGGVSKVGPGGSSKENAKKAAKANAKAKAKAKKEKGKASKQEMSATQINGGMGGGAGIDDGAFGDASAADGRDNTGNGFFQALANVEQDHILVMDDNGVVFRDGVDMSGGFKTVVKHLLHLNGVSSGQATKLRRASIHDAEKALKAAFTDFTRHEVARIRAQLASSGTLDAKLRDRLQKKLKLVEQELDASEEKELIEAAGGDVLQTHNIMAQLFKEQTNAQLAHKRQLAEQRSATAAMLRTRLTSKLTGIEGELRAQSAADGVIMHALSKLEQNMVELRSLLSIIPNSADKEGLHAYNMNKYRLINAVMVWTQKVELLCDQYGDGTELSKKSKQQRPSEQSVEGDAAVAAAVQGGGGGGGGGGAAAVENYNV